MCLFSFSLFLFFFSLVFVSLGLIDKTDRDVANNQSHKQYTNTNQPTTTQMGVPATDAVKLSDNQSKILALEVNPPKKPAVDRQIDRQTDRQAD